ncbi:MAG: flagellar export protein FliJ [bacterium]|jgi:flagellar export protein FliJ
MYKFSLQTVLELRERQEKLKMKEFAQVIEAERQVQEKIDEIYQRLKQEDKLLNQQKIQGSFSIDYLSFASHFKKKMKDDLETWNNRLQEAKKYVEEKRQELADASKLKKALEILKEKKEKQYWQKIHKHEQVQMDEAGSNLFQLKSARWGTT